MHVEQRKVYVIVADICNIETCVDFMTENHETVDRSDKLNTSNSSDASTSLNTCSYIVCPTKNDIFPADVFHLLVWNSPVEWHQITTNEYGALGA